MNHTPNDRSRNWSYEHECEQEWRIEQSSDSRRSVLVRLAGMSPAGTFLGYAHIAEIMGLADDDESRRKIQSAKSDAWLELGEKHGRALRLVRNEGYEVVVGREFFVEMLHEVGLFLRRARRIAVRLDHIDAQALTAAQRAARQSIAARLRTVWRDIRRDYRAGFAEDLPEIPEDDVELGD